MIKPGDIVILKNFKKAPFDYGEGLCLGYSDGFMRIWWYKNSCLTVHWSINKIKLKRDQKVDIEDKEILYAIEIFKYNLQTGLLKSR